MTDFVLGGEKQLSKKKIRKNNYWAKLESALDDYKNLLIISIDFVGSMQMQKARIALRGKAMILMGKNTIMRKIIRDRSEKDEKIAELLPLIRGNIGFVFTNETDLKSLRDEIIDFKQPAAAKAGILAPVNVTIPAGPTGLDPGQTSFFQTLNIATKITRGTIEITTGVDLCKAGEKVTTSAVALLSKLGIRPFEFGIVVSHVYEAGALYSARVLDLTDVELSAAFAGAAARLAAISFEIGQVNLATVPHSFGRAFKTLAAIGLAADYIFEELKEVKEMLDNPDAFAAPAAGDAAAAAAPVVEEEEEEEAAPAMDMFGGDEEEEGDY